jgi:uncharacterized damage-inducible protein DinB
MNYYGSADLAQAFRTVRKNTVAIAEDIPEKDYSFRPAPDVRTVSHTLVHIGLSTRLAEQIHKVERRSKLEGFDFPAFMKKMVAEEEVTRSKDDVVAFLRQSGDDFAAWLESLSDDFLAERVTLMPGMTPPSKTRFEMLLGVKEHEMHHRGQLMLTERLLGIVPHLTREMQARIARFTSGNVGAGRS